MITPACADAAKQAAIAAISRTVAFMSSLPFLTARSNYRTNRRRTFTIRALGHQQ
jgi:hypothetical protein